MVTENLVTIATFIEPMQAHICQARLEAEGIESFIFDENFAGTYWLITQAFGGAKLQVRQSDVDKAVRLLQRDESKNHDTESTCEDKKECCPNCGSIDILIRKLTLKHALLIIILGSIALFGILFTEYGCWFILSIPLIFWFIIAWYLQIKVWNCQTCGYSWKGTKMSFPT